MVSFKPLEIHKDVLDLIFLYTKNELLRGNGFTMYSKHPELFMVMRRIEAKIIQNHGYLKSHFFLSLECINMFVLKKIFTVIVGKLPF